MTRCFLLPRVNPGSMTSFFLLIFPMSSLSTRRDLLMSVNASHGSFCCMPPFFFSLFNPKKVLGPNSPVLWSSDPQMRVLGARICAWLPGFHSSLASFAPGRRAARSRRPQFSSPATVPRGQQEGQAGKSCSKFLLLSLRDSSNTGKPAERLSQSRRRSKEPQDPAATNS